MHDGDGREPLTLYLDIDGVVTTVGHQRRAGKDRLAEHQTETPANPIVEELGENRGS